MARLEYIEASVDKAATAVEVAGASGMLAAARAHEAKLVFRDVKKGEFFFPAEGVLLRLRAKGYETIEDAARGETGQFPSAKEFYEAQQGGYSTYAEYQSMKKAGIGSKEAYEKARGRGFVQGFEPFSKNYEQYKADEHLKLPAGLDNAVKLSEFAGQKGFANYADFEKAIAKGFSDKRLYDEALAKGYETAADFRGALQAGFSSKEEFEEAKKLMITTRKEFDNYRALKNASKELGAFDEAQLIAALKAQENGAKLTLAQVRKLLDAEQEKLKVQFEGETIKVLPLWYSRMLDRQGALEQFLAGNKQLGKIGSYNKEKQKFYVFKVTGKKVFVDGSNVAFNSSFGKNAKAEMKNIRRVVEELAFRGFTDITVIADASLKHRVEDGDVVKEIEKKAKYYEVPAKTDADEFILKSVRKEVGHLVSNDTFKDWRARDNWVKKNIDKVRVPFMITKEGRVMLSGID